MIIYQYLVKLYANCTLVRTYEEQIMSVVTSLRTKWQSTSICFALSWKIGFLAICNDDLLSQYNRVPLESLTPNSLSNYLIHFNSHVIFAIKWYFTSTEQEMFLVFQDIREEPRSITQLVKECLVSGQLI